MSFIRHSGIVIAAARRVFGAAITLVLAVICSVLLLRLSPGFDVDERELDPRLSRETVESIRRERAEKRRLLPFSIEFIQGLLNGSLGTSESYDRPVMQLVAERAGATGRAVSTGLCVGWVAAVAAALAAFRDRTGVSTLGAASASGILISVPSALMAIVCLLAGLPPSAAIAAVVFPRVYPHAHELFRQQSAAPHVLMARARGVYGSRLFATHVLPGALGPMIGLASASVPLAFGAAIPIESLADSAGLGQLAWQAALARDMPLLVAITLLLAAVVVTASLLSDLALAALRARSR
jgi:peptide/nickel transport system permease protein